VHHVVPTDAETVMVAVSGLELVAEVTLQGDVVREWNVLGEDTWSALPRAVDYRIGVDLKPHRLIRTTCSSSTANRSRHGSSCVTPSA
jgi:hypothetical protein